MSNVIKLLWETGSASMIENAPFLYTINIMLEDETRKEFSGEDIDEVRKRAMDYICKHYHKEHINTLRELSS